MYLPCNSVTFVLLLDWYNSVWFTFIPLDFFPRAHYISKAEQRRGIVDLFERLLDVIWQLTKSAVHFVEIFAICDYCYPCSCFWSALCPFSTKRGRICEFLREVT